jgi:hypothetical protein
MQKSAYVQMSYEIQTRFTYLNSLFCKFIVRYFIASRRDYSGLDKVRHYRVIFIVTIMKK